MAKWFGGALFLVLMLGAQEGICATYYVSKSLGADTKAGTSKTAPWAHLPGMPSCSGKCAAYTPAAGDRFILYGGDTWVASDLGIDWEWSGTSSSPIYIGVDKTWHKGSAWARPIFDCQKTSCSSNQFGNVIWLAGDWTILDDIEMKGFQQGAAGGMAMVATYGNNNEVEDMYVHGFSRTASATGDNSFCFSNNWSGGGAKGTKLHDNVCDGSDSSNQDFVGGVLHGDMVYDNVIRFVYNGLNGVFNQVYGNLIEDNFIATSGDHCNLVFIQAPFTGNTVLAYDNVIDQKLSHCSGGSTLWLVGNNNACPSCVTYAFNNVIYDTSNNFDPQGLITAGHQSNGQQGTYYLFNNTIDSGGDCMGSGETGSILATVHYANNDCVSTSKICVNGDVTCTDDGGNLLQSPAQASAAGYTDSETYAFSPTGAGSPTVGAGINGQSYCTALKSLNTNAYKACLHDVDYIVYDTVHHTVVHPRPAVTRPTSGAWDVGAYQYAPGSAGGSTASGGSSGATGAGGATGGSTAAGGSGATSAAGGSGGAAGSNGSASGGAQGSNSSNRSGGCGCNAPGRQPARSVPFALLSLLGWIAVRRRRRGDAQAA